MDSNVLTWSWFAIGTSKLTAKKERSLLERKRQHLAKSKINKSKPLPTQVKQDPVQPDLEEKKEETKEVKEVKIDNCKNDTEHRAKIKTDEKNTESENTEKEAESKQDIVEESQVIEHKTSVDNSVKGHVNQKVPAKSKPKKLVKIKRKTKESSETSEDSLKRSFTSLTKKEVSTLDNIIKNRAKPPRTLKPKPKQEAPREPDRKRKEAVAVSSDFDSSSAADRTEADKTETDKEMPGR